MLKAVALGDFHADKLRKHFPGNDIDLQLNEVRKVYRYAERNGIRNVFWLGDIGEGYKDFTGMLRMSEEAQSKLFAFWKSYDGTYDTHVIIGNHDYSGLESNTMKLFFELQRSKVFKTTKFYELEQQVKIDGVRVNFLPYPLLKPSDKRPSLCLAHYETSGAIRDNGRVIKDGEKHDYRGHIFVQGHLHTRQVVRSHFYPGTLYQTSFGESLPKGFMEFNAETRSDGKIRFKHRFIDTDPEFKLINVKVYNKKDLRQIEKNPLYKYKLFVSEEVRLTEQDLQPFDNIVNRLSFSDEKELEALEAAEFQLENITIDLSQDQVFKDFLKTKGLTKEQIKRCKQIIEKRGK